ncbi:MAG: hypothetical protein O7E57_07595, partial [Gammaproteobacteria bacterium]|nr:hypothetical protein [Gammaproteobacteria bacterium]
MKGHGFSIATGYEEARIVERARLERKVKPKQLTNSDLELILRCRAIRSSAEFTLQKPVPPVRLRTDPGSHPADLVSCLANKFNEMRRMFCSRQGATTSMWSPNPKDWDSHAGRSNAARGKKDQQIVKLICETGHQHAPNPTGFM